MTEMEKIESLIRMIAGTALLLVFALPSPAQWVNYKTPGIPRTPDGTPNLSAPAPRTADGKPDLSGIWMAPRIKVNVADGLKPGDAVPFQPWAKAAFEERRANNSKDDPSARCLPTGITLRPTLA